MFVVWGNLLDGAAIVKETPTPEVCKLPFYTLRQTRSFDN